MEREGGRGRGREREGDREKRVKEKERKKIEFACVWMRKWKRNWWSKRGKAYMRDREREREKKMLGRKGTKEGKKEKRGKR
jgi:hypothetical protein